VLFSHGPNNDFVVPEACRATVRNCNSISADFVRTSLKMIRTTLISAIFRQFGSCFGLFIIEG